VFRATKTLMFTEQRKEQAKGFIHYYYLFKRLYLRKRVKKGIWG
jgi:hypothetical protein